MTTISYEKDMQDGNFEQRTLPLKDDYEGKAIATLIRRLSDQDTSRAVLYVHGFNDYFFQEEMAFKFNENSYNFYAIDLRKYGRSYLPHQKFNDIRNLKDYYEEILASLEIIRREGNKYIFLIGHSTGGLILTLFAKDYNSNELYDGLILNSPFFEFNKGRLVRLALPIASFIGRFLPKITIPGGFSEQYGKSIHKDYFGEWAYNLKWKPNIAPKVNLGWVRAIYEGQKEVKHPFSLSKPVLVLHSEQSATNLKDKEQIQTRDTILNIKDIRRISNNIKGNIQITPIKDGLHDLILSRKPAREEVYKIMFDWLEKHGTRSGT